ncbi:hypothetical protein DND132_0730 [Pseudodesulfovibrio mercurii]|uniref:Methyltransferase domain-containing protein n=1 Tax=Pseudodesulfovibrio mercurii TaxID=641491 RepID=F0JH06_9BACT|nr:hypothetical protein [Pseudodesulfovibrio mercurii]EGB13945.1 hypothetical protein DND132_0730 [Pseudodesulfovibrio mercurii]
MSKTTIDHIQSPVHGAIPGGLTGSPLASAGMQARNFTAMVGLPAPAIAPDFYTPDPLVADVERLCDPDEPVSDTRLLNLAVKYFFAYVHEDAHCDAVPYAELAALYEQFSRHQSMNEPGDDIEVMNRLRMWSPVLRVLADAPRAAHVLRAVLARTDAAPACGPFVGVDLGAGTGIMLLALQILARRGGCSDIQTLGYQCDPLSGERTHDLVHALGAGSVMLADPAREHAFHLVRGRNVDFVANEVMAGIQQSLDADNCFDKYRAFIHAVGHGLDRAAFFPDGLVAHSTATRASVILARENGFQPPAEYLTDKFIPQGFILDGKVLPIHKLGSDFYRYLT